MNISHLAVITTTLGTFANWFLSWYLFNVLKPCVACGESVMANCILENLKHEKIDAGKEKKKLLRDPYNSNWSYHTPWEYVTCSVYQRRQHWTCTRVIVLFVNNTQWPVSIYGYRTAQPYSNSAPRDIHLLSLRISVFFFKGFSKHSLSLSCFLCIISSLFFSLPAFLFFFLSHSLLSFLLTGCLFHTPLGIWTQLYWSRVSFFCMFTTAFQASHTHTQKKNTANTPTKAKKKGRKTGSGYYSVHCRIRCVMSTYAWEQWRLAKCRSRSKQQTRNCKRCQTI